MKRSERIEAVEQVLRGPSYGGIEGLAERIVDALFAEPRLVNVWVGNSVYADQLRGWVRVVKYIRDAAGVSLKEAADAVRSTPGYVAAGLPEPVAKQLVNDLQTIGADAEIRELVGAEFR